MPKPTVSDRARNALLDYADSLLDCVDLPTAYGSVRLRARHFVLYAIDIRAGVIHIHMHLETRPEASIHIDTSTDLLEHRGSFERQLSLFD